jgi:hypothetical protein
MKTATLLFGLLALAPSLNAQDRSTDDKYRYSMPDRDADRRYDRGRRDLRISCGSCSRGRCSESEWREARRCEDRHRDVEKKEAEWRAEARKRRIDFENDMTRREREFRRREQERWEKHQREMARYWDRDHR